MKTENITQEISINSKVIIRKPHSKKGFSVKDGYVYIVDKIDKNNTLNLLIYDKNTKQGKPNTELKVSVNDVYLVTNSENDWEWNLSLNKNLKEEQINHPLNSNIKVGDKVASLVYRDINGTEMGDYPFYINHIDQDGIAQMLQYSITLNSKGIIENEVEYYVSINNLHDWENRNDKNTHIQTPLGIGSHVQVLVEQDIEGNKFQNNYPFIIKEILDDTKIVVAPLNTNKFGFKEYKINKSGVFHLIPTRGYQKCPKDKFIHWNIRITDIAKDENQKHKSNLNVCVGEKVSPLIHWDYYQNVLDSKEQYIIMNIEKDGYAIIRTMSNFISLWNDKFSKPGIWKVNVYDLVKSDLLESTLNLLSEYYRPGQEVNSCSGSAYKRLFIVDRVHNNQMITIRKLGYGKTNDAILNYRKVQYDYRDEIFTLEEQRLDLDNLTKEEISKKEQKFKEHWRNKIVKKQSLTNDSPHAIEFQGRTFGLNYGIIPEHDRTYIFTLKDTELIPKHSIISVYHNHHDIFKYDKHGIVTYIYNDGTYNKNNPNEKAKFIDYQFNDYAVLVDFKRGKITDNSITIDDIYKKEYNKTLNKQISFTKENIKYLTISEAINNGYTRCIKVEINKSTGEYVSNEILLIKKKMKLLRNSDCFYVLLENEDKIDPYNGLQHLYTHFIEGFEGKIYPIDYRHKWEYQNHMDFLMHKHKSKIMCFNSNIVQPSNICLV